MRDLLRWVCIYSCAMLAASGCTRKHYRINADRDTYGILAEQSAGAPWMPPPDYGVMPDPRARFAIPGSPDDPPLPIPAPRLYAYQMPQLAKTSRPHAPPSASRVQPGLVQPEIRRLPPIDPTAHADRIRHASYQQELLPGGPAGPAPATETPSLYAAESEGELRIVPIPESVWESIPATCLRRMFEFVSLRDEYQSTWHRQPGADARDDSPRLTLEDVVQQSRINSREYQTQKETLYRAALRLSLERYAYALKFTPSGNGIFGDYSHRRDAGITENNLNTRSTAAMEKILGTGGDLLARFANDVVLTFNGPDGFTADVGSELLLEISQPIFQRDIVFESLTQSERDVVYAARDFARFRKQFFRDLANSYYSLILTYRGIEIDAQTYFRNTRGFYQGEAEYRAGRLPRFQVDQFEQDSLTSRSRLITSCNSLERSLDELKLQIGLPTEMPINLDLTELEQLTRQDEAQAYGERVRRARRNLLSEREQASTERLNLLLNAATSLSRRMLSLAEIDQSQNRLALDIDRQRTVLARLSASEARWLVGENRQELAKELRAVPRSDLRVFQRTMDLVDSLTILVTRQLDLIARVAADPSRTRQLDGQLQQRKARLDELRLELEETVKNRELERIGVLVTEAEKLLSSIEQLEQTADKMLGYQPLGPQEQLQTTLQEVDALLAESEQLLSAGASGGLARVDISVDDGMLTALVQRYDLMNERGDLADQWRQIKLAGDDLRSVLDLHAAQRVRTQRDVNRVFDFTWDESDTRITFDFDTPLNRRAQRNTYRQSLINYQVAVRNLLQLEDSIKFAVRNQLRALEVTREQYKIAVASAALAYERIVTTRLQLQFGLEGIRARDVLDAQRDYAGSLSAVAAAHIRYILDRIELFLDLEYLQVDETGFWPYLYEDQHQPSPVYQIPCYAQPVYGQLPCGVWYSHNVKRMLNIPPGNAEVLKEASDRAAEETKADLEQLPPPKTP